MKKIETNFLIYDLAKKANFANRVSGIKFFSLTFLCSGIFIILFLLGTTLRTDLLTKLNASISDIFYLQAIFLATLSILGCYLTYKLTIPGQSFNKFFRFVEFLFLFGFGLFFTTLLTGAILEQNFNLHHALDLSCVSKTIFGMAIPIIIIKYLARKGYCIATKKTIIYATLSALCIGSVVNLFTCDIESYSHLLISHYGIVFIILAVFLILDKKGS